MATLNDSSTTSTQGVRIELLNGENWLYWKSMIEFFLSEVGALDIIDGKLIRHISDVDKQIAFNKASARGNKVLAIYSERHIVPLISSRLTVKQNWETLVAAFDKIAGSGYALFERWQSFSLDMTKDLNPQISEYLQTVSQLESANSTAAAPFKLPAPIVASHLLRSLPDSFATFRSSILASTKYEELTPEIVRSRILSEGIINGASSSIAAVCLSRNQPAKKKEREKCEYCLRLGHSEEKCFKKRDGISREEARAKKSSNSKGKKKKLSNVETVTDSSEDEYDAVGPSINSLSGNKNYPIFAYGTSVTSWMMDSGATHHMTAHISDFDTLHYHSKPRKVRLGDNTTTLSQPASGTVKVLSRVGDICWNITLENVLYVPELNGRFLATFILSKKGFTITHDAKLFRVKRGEDTIIIARPRGNNFFSHLTLNPSDARVSAISKTKADFDTWHQRFGHISNQILRTINSSENTPVLGVNLLSTKSTLSTCEGCLKGKQTRSSYPAIGKRAQRRFDLVHLDLTGPMRTKSIQGHYYVFNITDDFSSHVWSFYLKQKSEAFDAWVLFNKYVKNQYKATIKSLRSDHGGEFIGKTWHHWLRDNGVVHQLSTPHTPEQNGLAERMNRTLADSALAMLHHSGLPLSFWEYAYRVAVHVRNRTPRARLNLRTPFELIHRNIPNVSYFRVFGCLAYCHIPKQFRHKLLPHTRQLILIGYEEGTKGYILWDRTKRRQVISSDVIFEEKVFPYRLGTPPILSPTPITFVTPSEDDISLDPFDDDLSLLINKDKNKNKTPELSSEPIPPSTPARPSRINVDTSAPEPGPSTIPFPPSPKLRLSPDSEGEIELGLKPDSDIEETERIPTPPPELPGHIPGTFERSPAPKRVRKLKHGATNYRDLHTGKASRQSNRKSRLSHLEAQISFLAATQRSITGEPLHYYLAVSGKDADQWIAAMKEEIENLIKLGVFELVDKPKDVNIVDCRWVYKIKHDPYGNIERYRARLVAKGFTQVYGVDYAETFAPVARLDTIRFFIALIAVNDLELHHIDIKTAFLNADLEESIYMRQPPGFEDPSHPDKVWHLKKSIYGLKQASRQWNKTIKNALTSFGFKSLLTGDVCIFIHRKQGGDIFTIVVIYVDDFFLFGNSLAHICDIKNSISSKFTISDLGEASQFLGLHITRDRPNRTITINQRKYIEDVLRRFYMLDCKPARTPFSIGTTLVKNTETQTDHKFTSLYQSIVGSLMYAMLGTRPDISFSVNRLAQFGSNPNMSHMKAARHVLRYLSGTRDLAITYGLNNDTSIIGFSDSDWAGDLDDRRSTTGYLFMMTGAPIAWTLHKQRTVAVSTTQAEYQALSAATAHALWIENIIDQLNFDCQPPIPIYVDNKGAVDLSHNPTHHKRTKHIDIIHHAIRERVENGQVDVIHISTTDNISDLLTKPLPAVRHSDLVARLNLSPYVSARGSDGK